MSRRARIIAALALAAVLVIAGNLGWRWLAPAAATAADLRSLILSYELADAASWPEEAYDRTRLTAAEQATLKAEYEDSIGASATGGLQRRELALQPWRFMLKQRTSYPRMLNTGVGGRIVYYDFVRRTLNGDLIVRALVQRYEDKASWRFRTDTLKRLGRDWWPTGLVLEYRCTKTPGGWRITAVDALPLQLDAETGKLMHGYP